MKEFAKSFVLFSILVLIGRVNCQNPFLLPQNVEEEIQNLCVDINHELAIEYNRLAEANWAYASNVTDATAKRKAEAENYYAEVVKFQAARLNKFDLQNIQDQHLKRMTKKLTDIGDAVLSPEDFSALNRAITNMETTYASAKVPNYSDKSKMDSLEPDITNVMTTSRNPDELAYYWVQWHNAAGTTSKKDFFDYVELKNKAARINNFTSTAESWLDSYEDPTFEQQVENILEQLKPLYLQLHGYVRQKLFEFYGPAIVDPTKPIPISLLGNMWGQLWHTISDIVTPYPNKPNVDVTEEMLLQKYTPRKMFEMAEDFFVSLNMSKMPNLFWERSIIEKPNDGREMVCHASAWDFAKEGDVRIKQCTRVTMESLITVHHEMGHIEYYLQYHQQPFVFRGSANPGFHEAVGDVLALSVSTNRHLQRIGLLKNLVPDYETEINHLMQMGLEKLAFLPFAYAMDKFRYDVFRGKVKAAESNCYFWKLREKYSGVEPPVVRTNRDFDITAKYHASSDVEYLRYFVSFIVQFQFHKAACEKAGEYIANDPRKTLNDCDIYQSKEAGNALKAMLEMGSSKPWPDAMEKMTGQRTMDASAILEYFKPLHEWLLKTNKELGVNVGWKESDKIDCSI